MTSPSAVPDNSSVIPESLSKRVLSFPIGLSILMIGCGFLAILLPIEMSFGVVIVTSWLLMFSGITQFVHVFGCRGVGDGIWKTLIGVIYLLTGLYLRLNLALGIVALTLALVAFLVSQGLIDIFPYVRNGKHGISHCPLLDARLRSYSA